MEFRIQLLYFEYFYPLSIVSKNPINKMWQIIRPD